MVVRDFRDITMNKIAPESWAQQQELKIGDEILQLNGRDVLDMDADTFAELRRQRPLKIVVLSCPIPAQACEQLQQWSPDVKKVRDLTGECHGLKTMPMSRFGYSYMFRSAIIAFALPIKALPLRNCGSIKAMLVETRFWTAPEQLEGGRAIG
jgi:hypothetical protein